MKTRRLLYLGLALAMLLAVVLTACGGDSDDDQSGANGGQEQSARGAPAGFTEYPIGDEVQIEGLNIAAVYFQPVKMEPEGKAGLSLSEADIHLEADIHALKDNVTGFGFGEWIPYMTVKYQLKKGSEVIEGTFMPMNASDGPHYGANLKMMGAGKYQLTFIIDSPEAQGYLLHVDEETGVPGRFWRKPIEVTWEFNYLPRKF